MDVVHPGSVPLSKVNFNAKHDYEYIKNYKILQECFTKAGIDKAIDVNKLIKGKYQDNLEFLQWIKRYFDLHWQGGEYDAVARRSGSTRNQEQKKNIRSTNENANNNTNINNMATKDAIISLQKQIAELRDSEESLKAERDYYFEKLRRVEIKCETLENQQKSGIDACVFAKEIQEILYATAEEM
ncbi:hypothetical protein AKO1_001117 [Acrasis kona]|uniref:Uncharacterized protein n=1 Tax=Acrasis kona TaxID=1008807 RepID=A0AAW2ZBT3_9EUKA